MWRYYWDMFVLLLACYNALMTPFEVSFEYAEAFTQETPFWQIELSIDLIYFLDILIGFTTSFISPYNGDEYFDLLMIAKHYL